LGKQRVAVCCSLLQSVAVCCIGLFNTTLLCVTSRYRWASNALRHVWQVSLAWSHRDRFAVDCGNSCTPNSAVTNYISLFTHAKVCLQEYLSLFVCLFCSEPRKGIWVNCRMYYALNSAVMTYTYRNLFSHILTSFHTKWSLCISLFPHAEVSIHLHRSLYLNIRLFLQVACARSHGKSYGVDYRIVCVLSIAAITVLCSLSHMWVSFHVYRSHYLNIHFFLQVAVARSHGEGYEIDCGMSCAVIARVLKCDAKRVVVAAISALQAQMPLVCVCVCVCRCM